MGWRRAVWLFDRDGDCLAAKQRPGNVHSAEGEGLNRLCYSLEADYENTIGNIKTEIPINSEGTIKARSEGVR